MVLFVGIKTYSYEEKWEWGIGWFIMDDTKFTIYVYKKWLLYDTVTPAIKYQARTKDTGKHSIHPAVHSCREPSKPSCSLVVLSKIFQEAIAKACIDISFDNCLISYKLLVNAALYHLVTDCQGGKQTYFSKSSSGTVYPWSALCRFPPLPENNWQWGDITDASDPEIYSYLSKSNLQHFHLIPCSTFRHQCKFQWSFRYLPSFVSNTDIWNHKIQIYVQDLERSKRVFGLSPILDY